MSRDDLPPSTNSPATSSEIPSPAHIAEPSWTWWKIVILIVIVLVISGLVGSVVQSVRYARARARFKKQLAQLGVAVQQYEEQYGAFPPAYTVGKDGQRLHSWRTLLLPYLEQQELYQKVRLNEPWNSPHNAQFHGLRPEVYVHPWMPDSPPGETHALAIVGRETIWPEQYSAKKSDVNDGLSNSLLLVEYSAGEINWMEPRDLSRRDVLEKVFSESNPGVKIAKGAQVVLADGASRFIAATIAPETLRSLMSIAGGAPLAGIDWPPSPIGEMPALREIRPATAFSGTEVVPILAAPMAAGKNLVYCATLQIAWDQWRELTGSELKSDSDSELVTQLNLHRFDRRNLAPESYIAYGGRGDGLTKIMEQRHALKLQAPLLQNAQTDPVEGFLLYAALVKRLPFPVEFDRWQSPLLFRAGETNVPVKSFGIYEDPHHDGRVMQMVKQVEILDHLSDTDFIAKLQTRGGRDEIFLAKIPPAATLEATLQAALRRVEQPARNGFRKAIGHGDKFQIPDLELSIKKDFDELTRIPFRDTTGVEQRLLLATQSIQFRLDEKGAVVESEALIIGENGSSSYDPDKIRKLVFDQPFLLWMQERGASAPYLVAWIANSEWMTPLP